MKNPEAIHDQIIDLLRDRTALQKQARPILARIEEIEGEIRRLDSDQKAACAEIDASHGPRSAPHPTFHRENQRPF